MKITHSFLVLSLSFVAAQTFAQASTKQADDVAELSTITVSGSEPKGPEVTTEKLLKVPGAGNDPLKAIEALPGVVLGGFGPFSIPAIRGSSPRDNTYITDFVPVGYVFHNDGNSTYNDNLIENFSLKAGAWGPEYNDAIGAVLSTKLRDPYSDNIQTTLDLSLLRVGALIEGAVSQNSAFYFSYRQSLLEFYVENFIDKDELTFTEVPKNNDYQFKYHWRIDPVSNVRFIATGANDSVGIDFGPESDALETEPGLAGGLAADTYYHNQAILYDTLFKGGTSMMFALSRKEEKTDFFVGSLFDLDAINYEQRIKHYFNSPLNNGDTIRYGYDIANIEIDYSASGLNNYCNSDIGNTCQPASLGVPFDQSDKLSINTVYSFVAYDWLVSQNLELTLGLGNSYNDFNEENLLQPRISSRYQLNDAWTLTAAVGRHNQYIREFRFIAEELGNPELKQPDAIHYVAGFEHTFNEAFSTKLEVYYKTIDNLITANSELISNPNATPKYTNNASGHAYGLELLINKNLTDQWYGWFSLAYSKTKRENEETNQEINYELDRPWIMNLVASYQKSAQTTYGFKWRYQSGNLVTPINGATAYYDCNNTLQTANNCGAADAYIYDPIEGDVNSQRLSDYHRLDFRLDYDMSSASTLYFEVINLYNRANVSDYSYNKDYSEKEEVTSLPIIFSVGGKWVF